MTDKKETYLGDGLYASFDGFMITLRAPRLDNQYGGVTDHWVGLDLLVFEELLRFVRATPWKLLLREPNQETT